MGSYFSCESEPRNNLIQVVFPIFFTALGIAARWTAHGVNKVRGDIPSVEKEDENGSENGDGIGCDETVLDLAVLVKRLSNDIGNDASNTVKVVVQVDGSSEVFVQVKEKIGSKTSGSPLTR